jgi:hypothetical protein
MAPELIARIDKFCLETAALARAVEVMAIELADLRDTARAALGLTPIADERQGSIVA